MSLSSSRAIASPWLAITSSRLVARQTTTYDSIDAALGERPLALERVGEAGGVGQAGDGVGRLGVAQLLGHAAQVGAPAHGLPLVGEHAARRC